MRGWGTSSAAAADDPTSARDERRTCLLSNFRRTESVMAEPTPKRARTDGFEVCEASIDELGEREDVEERFIALQKHSRKATAEAKSK